MARQLDIGSRPETPIQRSPELPAESSFCPAAELAWSPDPMGRFSPQQVKWLLRGRRRRGAHFEAELFADPAWDIMLYLFGADLEQRRVSVTSVCIASNVPSTTALRWLTTLEHKGLVRRRSDPLDARRVFVELTASAKSALRRWFAETFAEDRVS